MEPIIANTKTDQVDLYAMKAGFAQGPVLPVYFQKHINQGKKKRKKKKRTKGVCIYVGNISYITDCIQAEHSPVLNVYN